jgi:hypothetical protein
VLVNNLWFQSFENLNIKTPSVPVSVLERIDDFHEITSKGLEVL